MIMRRFRFDLVQPREFEAINQTAEQKKDLSELMNSFEHDKRAAEGESG